MSYDTRALSGVSQFVRVPAGADCTRIRLLMFPMNQRGTL